MTNKNISIKIPTRIPIGGKTSAELLIRNLEKNNIVSDWAKDIIRKMPLAKEKQIIEIEVVSVEELEFTGLTRRDEIYKKAQELGYGILPAEAGVALRLAYDDQPIGEWLLIGMEPITASDGYLNVFRVGCREDGQWLYASYGYPGRQWDPGYRWVFARRKYPLL